MNQEYKILLNIVKESKEYWDKLGKSYPEHLQSTIDYLDKIKKLNDNSQNLEVAK